MKPLHDEVDEEGSVVLVALCFVAIIGITLAGYLAVSNQAMRLSNRTYLKSVNGRLAEMGIEKALWSLNFNNWDTATWTISGSNASASFVPSASFSDGVSRSVRVRVENYNSPVLASEWDSGATYTVGDIVSFTNMPPWDPSYAYSAGDIVYVGTTIYRCVVAHTGQSPAPGAYWIPSDNSREYRAWYRCTTSNPTLPPPHSLSWEKSTPLIIAEGLSTPTASGGESNSVQLRCVVSVASLFPNAAAGSASISLTPTTASSIDSYNSDPDSDSGTPAIAYSGASATYSATICGGSRTSTAVSLANTTVKGFVSAPSAAVSPFAPRFSTGGMVTVTGNPVTTGIDLTRITRSPYIPQFAPLAWNAVSNYRVNDVVRASDDDLYICVAANINSPPPGGSWVKSTPLVLAGGTTSIGTPGALKLYRIDGVLSRVLATDILEINGPVIIDVHGDITISSGKISITAQGSAELLLSGQLEIGTSGGGIENLTLDPKKLLVFRSSSPGTIGHFMNTSMKFYGSLFLPNCSLRIEPTGIGSGIFGAVSAGTISCTTKIRIHYDTSLRRHRFRTIDTPFTLTEWRELTDQAERVTLP